MHSHAFNFLHKVNLGRDGHETNPQNHSAIGPQRCDKHEKDKHFQDVCLFFAQTDNELGWQGRPHTHTTQTHTRALLIVRQHLDRIWNKISILLRYDHALRQYRPALMTLWILFFFSNIHKRDNWNPTDSTKDGMDPLMAPWLCYKFMSPHSSRGLFVASVPTGLQCRGNLIWERTRAGHYFKTC